MASAAAAGAEVENITIVSAEGERFTVPKKVRARAPRARPRAPRGRGADGAPPCAQERARPVPPAHASLARPAPFPHAGAPVFAQVAEMAGLVKMMVEDSDANEE